MRQFILICQKFLCDAVVKMLPRGYFIKRAGTVGIKGGIKSAFAQRLKPTVKEKAFIPAVKTAALSEGGFYDPPEPTVTASQDSLQKAGLIAVPAEGYFFRCKAVAQIFLPSDYFIARYLRLKLKRREGFRNKA